MNPARKRKVRLVVCLTAALVLAGMLMFTSFSAGSPEKIPSQIGDAKPGQKIRLAGRVVKGTLRQDGDVRYFRMKDPLGTVSVPVSYPGSVPDPFREGRDITVTVTKQADGSFAGERGTLITKCPSKFTTKPQAS